MHVWDDLRYVLAVGRHGSLARAAKALGTNKSTVSRRIAALEEQLGASLLQRGPGGLDLTAAGRAAAATAERIEQLVGELAAEFGNADRVARGTVRVTVPGWFAQHILIPALPALREEYPGLEVHLLTTDDVLDLAGREADIGVRNVRPTQQSLTVRKGGNIWFAMYASRAYLDAYGLPASRNDFEDHQLVAYGAAVAHVTEYRWANALPSPVAFRAADATSMLDAVANGLGIGVLPCFLATPRPELVCLESVGGPRPETIWLVTHSGARDVERVRVVARWLARLFDQNAELLAGRG